MEETNGEKTCEVVVTETNVTLYYKDQTGKRRTLKRKCQENIQKTIFRLMKSFVNKKSTTASSSIELQGPHGLIASSELEMDITVLQGFTAATALHVDIISNLKPENEKESSTTTARLVYSIILNPPRIVSLHYRDSLPPTVGWHIYPQIEVENTAMLTWSWVVGNNSNNSNKSSSSSSSTSTCIVGTACRFNPTHDQIGKMLSVICTPIHQDGRQGSDVVLEVGVVRNNPCHGGRTDPRLERCYKEKKLSIARSENRSAAAKGSRETSTAKIYRIMTYNILADHCCSRQDGHRALAHIKNPEFWNIDYRKHLILEEIVASDCDVILLQECGTQLFRKFLLPHLSCEGYSGQLHTKTTLQDGCAIFFRMDTFDLVSAIGITSRDSARARLHNLSPESPFVSAIQEMYKMNTVFQICALREKNTTNVLVCGNSHFYYHPRGEHIRLLQAQLLLMELNDIAQQYPHTSILVAGDFNATPETATLEYLRNGIINERTLDRLFIQGITTEGVSTTDETLPSAGTVAATEANVGRRHGNFTMEWSPSSWSSKDCVKSLQFSTMMPRFTHPLQLECTHDKYLVQGSRNQPLTTLTPTFDGTLDYIFIDARSLIMEHVWDLFETATLEENMALPNIVFPSDHVAVICEISFSAV
jgi:2',5'-phosphodiesterase